MRGDQVDLTDVAVPRFVRVRDELDEPRHLAIDLGNHLVHPGARRDPLDGRCLTCERHAHRPLDHPSAGQQVVERLGVPIQHGAHDRPAQPLPGCCLLLLRDGHVGSSWSRIQEKGVSAGLTS